jgi:hypothetical protein
LAPPLGARMSCCLLPPKPVEQGMIRLRSRRALHFYLQGRVKRSPTAKCVEEPSGERFEERIRTPSCIKGRNHDPVHPRKLSSLGQRNDYRPGSTKRPLLFLMQS